MKVKNLPIYPLKWFIDRIGKTIYRNPLHGRGYCICTSCKNVGKAGLIIKDVNHAKYIHGIQHDLNIKYYDK